MDHCRYLPAFCGEGTGFRACFVQQDWFMTQDVSVSSVVGVQGPARWLRQAGLVLAGTVVLSLSSYVSIPLSPVPVSMQTFAVLMVGAIYGWRLGGLTGSMPFCVELDNLKDTDAHIHQPAAMLVAAD
jgi:hypothetical protein